MFSNVRRPNHGLPRPSSARPDGEAKQIRKVPAKKVFYRVGYTWNKGGRLKELRTRHLARKFLKIWMRNTFGRILPHKAKFHHDNVVLRRAFEGWTEEWWTSRREWSLTMRAQCHYRYYLYNMTFQRWRTFISLQREKKRKLQNAQSFADRQQMRLVWDRWELFIEMRQMKNRMLESALEQNRIRTLHTTWNLWQSRLQQCYDLYKLEVQAQKQHALTLQRRAWLKWKKIHTAACCQKEKESMASLHFTLKLKSKTLHQWMSYVPFHQAKKQLKAGAQHACYLSLLRTCWSRWNDVLHRRWSEEERLQAAGHLAIQRKQRRALKQWRAYVKLCREEVERDQMANQHHHHHLLSAGLQGLSVNIILNKTHRLNNNLAVQHHCQSVLSKYWKLWQDHLEEAEDKSFQPLTEWAQTKYSTSLLKSFFQQWKEKLAEQRHMQELEQSADIWFAVRVLPRCFNSWIEFTLQRKLKKQRRHKAQIYNQQRQYSWVFYTWCGQSEKRRAQMLTEQMAILHEKKCHMQRAWSLWRQRTQQKINEEEKEKASYHLYLQRLSHRTLTQWKDNSSEIRDRRNREQQACHQGNLRCMKLAVQKWKKLVQRQRVKKRNLEQMQHYHGVKLLKRTFVAWKTHHLQMSHIYAHAEELYRKQTQHFLRMVLSVWRENAVLLAEVRLKEQQAQNHFQHFLQLKVFLAWREATTHAVLKHHQQEEAFSRAQNSVNQVRLVQYFRHSEVWNKQHSQNLKYKVMKRQGILLLRLKMYQLYFEQWKIKLQHRRRETKQTERALWHWSLTLQAKVLYGWRLWYSEEQKSHHLQRVVKRCAMRWKQRALCKSKGQKKVHGQPPKKSVSFHLSTNELNTVSPSDLMELTEDEDKVFSKLLPFRMPRRQPCRYAGHFGSSQNKDIQKTFDFAGADSASEPLDFSASSQDNHPTVISCLLPAASATHQNTNTCTVSPSDSRMSTVDSTNLSRNITQTEGLLLPPSAFMTTGNQIQLGKTSRSAHEHTPFKLCSPIYSEMHLRASSGESVVPCVEDAAIDPASALTRELLSIKVDMKSFQQDRKQLRAWRKMKEVFEGWLQTSGKEEPILQTEICQEVKELEECINRLSIEVAQRKPTMLLHAERIQHLESVLHTSGGCLRFQRKEEMETAQSVFTT
ncbi:hypothetical protein Q5P01_001585 [Channa striata]|uniref:Protein SFI1 homolog n=1 Tax=Channa striata TaxID=64152 RepID=A0AA88T433_CHASR|nr:hypothetical protein Q5P01_001585 [Channa striata]